ncbi:Ankyrin repeat-containing protein ITN1 [Linum perenne]
MATHSNIIPTCRDVLDSVGDRRYDNWCACLKSYLLSQDLWDLITKSCAEPPPTGWRRRNAAALHAIHISLGPDVLHQIREIDYAKEAWDTLANLHNQKDDEPEVAGDTKGISNFIGSNPESARFRFQPGRGTALHLAAKLGNAEVVEELMKWMDEEDLEIQDDEGSTALHIAASKGHLRVAELMVRKNSSLVTVMNKRGMIPLRVACERNFKELATFLYRTTPTSFLCEENDGKYGANILVCCILGQMFDIALDFVRRRKGMATAMDANKINVAIQLSTMPEAFPSGSPIISRSDFRQLEELGMYEAFDNAVKNGIVEFVKRAIEAWPALLHRRDKKGRNVVMSAVEFRQEKVFNMLLYSDMSSDAAATTTLSSVDNDRNTVLHLAGMLSTDAKLLHVSGAALQMQRELQWFLEVEKVVSPMYKKSKNRDSETASQIFTRTHKNLASSGEKWMKETATSATVVGALIITIMFTAVFTVPGGNNQETGIPLLLNQWAFRIFVVSDSVSQFAASTSVLMFLAILTSRYSEIDFLRSLPTKMVIGLSMLFISIATMMVAFCATIVMVMDRQWEYVVPIILVASVPVSLFMLLQFPLLVEIFMSTYGFGIFRRK